MEDNNILNFWNNKDLYSTPQDLKKYAREHYTEDFINNINKWKSNLKAINESMKDQLANHYKYANNYWNDMSYNYFCEQVISLIELTIDKKNDIIPSDINEISTILINNYYQQQIPIIKENAFSVSNLINSIKKPIYF